MFPLLAVLLAFLSFFGTALGDYKRPSHRPPSPPPPPKPEDKPAPKPVVTPPLTYNLAPVLSEHLPRTWGDWRGWASGWIPKPCREAATQKQLNPWEMEVYSVKYTDCDEPWTICRYFNDSRSIASMVETLGKIPIGMREYVSTIVTLPDLGPGVTGCSFSEADVPVIDVRDGFFTDQLLTHEISHVLDAHALRQYGGNNGTTTFSKGDWWKGNYSLDAAAVSQYSMKSWPENFAEVGISALYDLVVPGGIANVTKDANLISHGISTYKNVLGDIIRPQSKPKCTKRWPNHEVVPVSDKWIPPYPAPDVKIKAKGIDLIENVSKEEIKCVLPHEQNLGA